MAFHSKADFARARHELEMEVIRCRQGIKDNELLAARGYPRVNMNEEHTEERLQELQDAIADLDDCMIEWAGY